MDYISLTGTQIVAVLNPFLALIEQGHPLEKVYLLATRRTRVRAKKIRDYMVSNQVAPKDIVILPVSDRLVADDYGPPVQEVITKIESTDRAFNLAGGANFQIVACVQAISANRCLYLYPESSQIHAILMERFNVLSRDSLPLPKPVDVLSLQGIQAEEIEKKISKSSFFQTMIRRCHIDLPEGTMRNVRITSPSLNKPVVFDLVWNIGNELKFLKSIAVDGTSRKQDYFKNEARLILGMATGKDFFSELFHRTIGVLTNNEQVDARLKEEGSGKIESFFMSIKSRNYFAEKALKKFMEPTEATQRADKNYPIERIVTGNIKKGNTLLITALGNEILTTLIALRSHNPDNVCFIYTPGVRQIQALKKNIVKEKKMFPVQKIHFYPAGVDGASIMNIDFPDYESVMVNITPGTKGHAAFLTLWALKHGYPVFSLKTSPPVYEQIPFGDQGNQKLPDILLYSKLKGARVQSSGLPLEAVRKSHKQHESILSFLRLMDQENVPVSEFYFRKIELKNAQAKSEPLNKNTVRISLPGKRPIVFSTKNDEWFEALTGYVMILCAATDLRIRFRTAWPEPIQKQLLSNPNFKNQIHLSDVDVIATIDNTYYVISCKISDKKNVGQNTLEAIAFASLFGRFAIPMMCFLKYQGEPYNSNNGVYIFGYKTLCDTNRMTALLQRAKAERSTFGKS